MLAAVRFPASLTASAEMGGRIVRLGRILTAVNRAVAGTVGHDHREVENARVIDGRTNSTHKSGDSMASSTAAVAGREFAVFGRLRIDIVGQTLSFWSDDPLSAERSKPLKKKRRSRFPLCQKKLRK